MRHVLVGVMLGCAAVLAGCDTSVDPIVGTDKAFSLYGVLQPRADTQWVRVFPVTERLELTPPESLSVSVTSVDVERGERVTWRDSLIQEDDGRYAHVFWTPRSVKYDHTYRLDVLADDDRTAQVEVPVPSDAALARQDPQAEASPVIVPVRVTRAVPRLINVEVVYYVQYDLQENVGGNRDPAVRMGVSYTEASRVDEDGWVVPIDLSADYVTLRERLIHADLWNPAVGLAMRHMTLHLEVVNEAWDPPGGEFDPNVLVEPGVMSNVNGGFGFVGAGYPLRAQWRPEKEVLERAGWTDPSGLH